MIIGKLSDADAIDRAVQGADAVVSALGPSLDRKATGLPLVDGTRHILDAMKRHSVTRYIGHGTPSILDPREKPTWQTKLVGFMGRTGLPRAYQELIGMTELIMNAGVDWTIVRFTAPKDTPKTGKAAGRVLRHRPHRVRRFPRRHRRIHRRPGRRRQLHQPGPRDQQLTRTTHPKESAARMNIAVWIVSGLLAAAYLFAGTNKATRPKDKLVDSLPWAEDLSPATIKFVGIMEILGAIGLILPWLTGIAAVLTPLAATGLVILQLLAIIVHLRRREAKVVPMNTILLLAALFVAILRYSAL